MRVKRGRNGEFAQSTAQPPRRSEERRIGASWVFTEPKIEPMAEEYWVA